MKKKLKLSAFEVKSFVTQVNANRVKGGETCDCLPGVRTLENCQYPTDPRACDYVTMGGGTLCGDPLTLVTGPGICTVVAGTITCEYPC
jgi:hypothetical protein